jgi:Tfp pilus assembly protein PilE
MRLFKQAARSARTPMDFYTLIAVIIAVVIAAILVWIIVPRGPRI